MVVCWANGKTAEERPQYLQGLNDIVSKGKGNGTICPTAFPQEMVNIVAAKTGGRVVTISQRELAGHVVLENNYRDFYFVHKNGTKKFLFRFEIETRKFSRPSDLNVANGKAVDVASATCAAA